MPELPHRSNSVTQLALLIACPRCRVAGGEPCRNVSRGYRHGWPIVGLHAERRQAARGAVERSNDA